MSVNTDINRRYDVTLMNNAHILNIKISLRDRERLFTNVNVILVTTQILYQILYVARCGTKTPPKRSFSLRK